MGCHMVKENASWQDEPEHASGDDHHYQSQDDAKPPNPKFSAVACMQSRNPLCSNMHKHRDACNDKKNVRARNKDS